MIVETIILVRVALCVGVAVTMIAQKNMAHTAAKSIVEEAKKEAEVLKKNKLLEAK